VLLDVKVGGVHPVNASVHPVNAVFTGKTPYMEDKTSVKTKAIPPAPLFQRGVTKRDIRRITKLIEQRRGAWDGMRDRDIDSAVDAIARRCGVDPDAFRLAVEWPRTTGPELERPENAQETPCTATKQVIDYGTYSQ
jgi:hypothetical protein